MVRRSTTRAAPLDPRPNIARCTDLAPIEASTSPFDIWGRVSVVCCRRLIIEGTRTAQPTADRFCPRLRQLAEVCVGRLLLDPARRRSDTCDSAESVCWKASRARSHAWQPPTLFSGVSACASTGLDVQRAPQLTTDFMVCLNQSRWELWTLAYALDFTDAELRGLAHEVRAPDASEPFGAYVFRHDEPGANLGRYVEQSVFLEVFGNTPELLAEEYRRYEPSSLFICVIDHLREVPAGAMRVLVPSRAGFKSLNDIEPVWGVSATSLIENTGLALDVARTWDVATLAVAPEYRGKATRGLVTMGLVQTVTILARRHGIEWLVMILDMPVFRLLRWKLLMVIAGYKGIGPLPYLGSAASIPAWCDLVHAQSHFAANDRTLHDIVFLGEGLEPALRRFDLGESDRLRVAGRAV